jgi:hypothetical protein
MGIPSLPGMGFRRFKPYELGDVAFNLSELSALDADRVWGLLSEGEQNDKLIEGYCHVVVYGAVDDAGAPVYTLDDVRALPARLVVEMAETIMELTGLGVDPGKGQPDGDEKTS